MATQLPVSYEPTPSLYDNGKYEIQTVSRQFNGDDVARMGFEDIEPCATSPHWEDRIRAARLMHTCRVTMPDQFPCIYETPESPNLNRDISLRRPVVTRASDAWVVSPDIQMLEELLPEYQAMWDDYILVKNTHWGPSARRVFAVGRLDGLSPHGVYRPGTGCSTVLLNAARLHGMRVPKWMNDGRYLGCGVQP